jgi:hypothetical protein
LGSVSDPVEGRGAEIEISALAWRALVLISSVNSMMDRAVRMMNHLDFYGDGALGSTDYGSSSAVGVSVGVASGIGSPLRCILHAI